jgi:hypothetical protein
MASTFLNCLCLLRYILKGILCILRVCSNFVSDVALFTDSVLNNNPSHQILPFVLSYSDRKQAIP